QLDQVAGGPHHGRGGKPGSGGHGAGAAERTHPAHRESRRGGSRHTVRLRAEHRSARSAGSGAEQLLRLRRAEREPRVRPMRAPRRVVVTGMGMVSAAGAGGAAAIADALGAAAIADALARPATGIAPVRAFETNGW